MWEAIRMLEFRSNAGISDANAELNNRLSDRLELPLAGIHGEKLYLTGITLLRKKAAELDLIYGKLPKYRGVQDTILLDSWSSATIEGARTTVSNVRKSMTAPKTKDNLMVINTIKGSNYAYGRPITEKTFAGSGILWLPMFAKMKT